MTGRDRVMSRPLAVGGVGLALWLEVSFGSPLWVHFLLWVPLALVLCLTALRLIKGVLITLQYANKAEQGKLDRPQ